MLEFVRQTIADWFNRAPTTRESLEPECVTVVLKAGPVPFLLQNFILVDDKRVIGRLEKLAARGRLPSSRKVIDRIVQSLQRKIRIAIPKTSQRPMSLLTLGTSPLLLLDHQSGYFADFVEISTEGFPIARRRDDPRDIKGFVEARIREALKAVHLPPETKTNQKSSETGLQNTITLRAPRAGILRILAALPPPDAPDRNTWWSHIYVSDTHLATISPKCRPKGLKERVVRSGEFIGCFASSEILWPGSQSSDTAETVDVNSLSQIIVSISIGELLRRSNSSVASIVELNDSQNLVLFSWLHAGGDEVRQQARAQALASFPLLAACACDEGSLLPEVLTESIDKRQPLLPVLQDWLKTSPSALKSAARIRQRSVGRERFSLLGKGGLQAVGELPADRIPGRGVAPRSREWRIFLDIYGVVRNGRGEILAMQAFTAGGALWAQLTQDAAGQIRNRVLHVVDCFHAAYVDLVLANTSAIEYEITGNILSPADAQFIVGRSEGGRILCGDRGFLALEQVATEWTRQAPTIDSAAVRLGPELASWPALTGKFHVPDTDLIVSPLTSTAELEEEGKTQGHCLGVAYADECLFEPIHIVSIRDNSGSRVSTAELWVSEDGGQLQIEILQHYGANNQPPAPNARASLDVYLDAISDGTVSVDWDTLFNALNSRLKTAQRLVTGQFGYNVRDPLIADAVFDAWRFALPSANRRLSRSAWIEAVGLRQAVERSQNRLSA